MNTIEIPEVNFYKEFPSELDELKPSEFEFLVKQVIAYQSGVISENDMLTAISFHLIGIRKSVKWFRLNQDQIEIVVDNVNRINEIIRDFFDEQQSENGQKILVFKNGVSRNLLPKIKKLYGPDSVLQNCSFFEYKQAHAEYVLYLKNQNIENLNRLIAILYRPKKWFLPILKLLPNFPGDVRRKFSPLSNPLILEKRVKYVSKLPYYYKYAFFLIYTGFESFLRTGDIEIDGNEISLSALYSNSTGTEDTGVGLTGLLYELSESKVFGSVNDTANTNLYDVLVRIYQLVKMSEIIKRKADVANQNI